MASLPPLLMTSELGSFAKRTIEKRIPNIIVQIISHSDFTPSIRKALLNLKDELESGIVTPLTENTSDKELWDTDSQPWIGRSWLDIPWMFAETFFYRKVLEIVKYFQPGPCFGLDPYRGMKEVELCISLPVFLETYKPQLDEDNLMHFQAHCTNALWANRGIISNLDAFNPNIRPQNNQIIINHIDLAFKYIRDDVVNIAYFLDNVGSELYFDLAFIDFLIQSKLAKSVTCYLKNQPFFVTDVMPKDFMNAIHHLESSQSNVGNALAFRFRQLIQSEKVILKAPPFLTTSRSFHSFPNTLRNQIAEHDLVILKGDVNFRKLFGDCHWNPTTDIEDAGNYFPISFLSLRTLKSELILGLTAEQFRGLNENAKDDWMINAKQGMITFYQK